MREKGSCGERRRGTYFETSGCAVLCCATLRVNMQGGEVDWCSARMFTVLDIPGHPLGEEMRRMIAQKAAQDEQRKQHEATMKAAQEQGMPTAQAQLQPLPGHCETTRRIPNPPAALTD